MKYSNIWLWSNEQSNGEKKKYPGKIHFCEFPSSVLKRDEKGKIVSSAEKQMVNIDFLEDVQAQRLQPTFQIFSQHTFFCHHFFHDIVACDKKILEWEKIGIKHYICT